MNTAREVNTQEWKTWIGHRIDQATHQMMFLWGNLVVFTAERHYSYVEIGAGHTRYAVTVQTGAVDQIFCAELSG